MENLPAEEPSPPPVHPAARSGGPRLRLARWAKELVTVFVGVYAAFMLNNYQAHRQERQRREQVLAWAQSEYSQTLTFVNEEEARLRQATAIFHRRIEAGEMPALHAFNFRTDYNPTDFTSMLQSGGFDLLEIETVRDIREVEGSLRQMIEVIQHTQQLSDALVLPNLDQPPSFFYDASQRKLRPGYAFYPDYFDTQLKIFAEMRPEVLKVLAQLQAERERNR